VDSREGIDGLGRAGGHQKFSAILAAEHLLSWPYGENGAEQETMEYF